ncbi:MAG TPA: hypothetical protein VG454_09225 [Gemmatimonadales bacterium]|nr:hypothetical protein [Gemmatimonadales bacterium]
MTPRALILGLGLLAATLHAQEIDTARALTALREAQLACTIDSAKLWHKSLCGPIALADRQTRLVIANDTVSGRHYLRLSDGFVLVLPATQFIANTSFRWGDRDWTLVALPLPADLYQRISLLMHEVFHREQGALGLRAVDELNNHLDFREGREWLRLEYRALAAALQASDSKTLASHAKDALLFRAMRRSLYPGSDSLETALEIQEGLPEYTGQHLALELTGEGRNRVARYVLDYEKNTPSFVRAFAYGTGPALGVLLDTLDRSWRDDVRTTRDLSALLARALKYQPPKNLAAAARRAAPQYGWHDIEREEAARDSTRAPLLHEYRARLADGPSLLLRQSKDSLSWGYDPTTMIAFDLRTTIYPWGTFSAPWGKLEVEKNGVLVANDFSTIRVGLREPPDKTDRITGDGWTLTLSPGWTVRPDSAKPGSFVVTKGE